MKKQECKERSTAASDAEKKNNEKNDTYKIL